MNFISEALKRDIRTALRLRRFEKSEGGIYLNDAKLSIGGEMSTQLMFGPSFRERGPERIVGQNKIVDQGLILALINALAGGAQILSWYVMPFKNNATPQSNWTGTNVSGNAGEFTNYDEATRPALVFPDPTTIVTPSLANPSPSITTIGAGADKTLWGGAVVAANAKNDATAGVKLYAAVKFSAARTGLQTGDGIGWTYQVTATG